MSNYNRYLEIAKKTGLKTHLQSAITLAFFFFIIFGYYAYAFYFGNVLVTNGKINTNTGLKYNSGDVVTCFFGVVFGVFSLGMATNSIKAIVEGKVAGKMAYDII